MRISYLPGNTWFHHMDPITKAIWCIQINVWMICLRDPLPTILAGCLILLVSIAGARLNLKNYFKALRIMIIGGIGIVLYQGIFRAGPGIDVWFVHLSFSGLMLGTAIITRLIGTVASALAFSTTTSPKDLSTSMIKIGISYRIAHVVYLSLRLLPIVANDFQTINDVQQLRGVKKSFKKTIKTLITLLATEIRRAKNITIALDTRAFGLYSKRTVTNPISISKSGIVLVIITLITMIFHLIYLWPN